MICPCSCGAMPELREKRLYFVKAVALECPVCGRRTIPQPYEYADVWGRVDTREDARAKAAEEWKNGRCLHELLQPDGSTYIVFEDTKKGVTIVKEKINAAAG